MRCLVYSLGYARSQEGFSKGILTVNWSSLHWNIFSYFPFLPTSSNFLYYWCVLGQSLSPVQAFHASGKVKAYQRQRRSREQWEHKAALGTLTDFDSWHGRWDNQLCFSFRRTPKFWNKFSPLHEMWAAALIWAQELMLSFLLQQRTENLNLSYEFL